MTDRQLLARLGRSVITALSVAILATTGIAYAELTYQAPPPVVDVIYVR